MEHLRRHRFLVDVAERWLPHAGVRKDLFGFLDIVAIDTREPAIVGIQATTRGHVGDRLAKARSIPALRAWLRAGAEFWVMGWDKPGERWKVKIVAVKAGDLEAVPIVGRMRRTRKPRQRELFV